MEKPAVVVVKGKALAVGILASEPLKAGRILFSVVFPSGVLPTSSVRNFRG
jgi:hypothetical protein